jgi:hypothetical protein
MLKQRVQLLVANLSNLSLLTNKTQLIIKKEGLNWDLNSRKTLKGNQDLVRKVIRRKSVVDD